MFPPNFMQAVTIWLPATLAVMLIAAFLVYLTILAHRRRVETGVEGLVGEEGEYRGGGKVFVHGELWSAPASEDLSPGDAVVVESVHRMKLRVRKLR